MSKQSGMPVVLNVVRHSRNADFVKSAAAWSACLLVDPEAWRAPEHAVASCGPVTLLARDPSSDLERDQVGCAA